MDSRKDVRHRLNRALALFVSMPLAAGGAAAQEAVSIRVGGRAAPRVSERVSGRIDVAPALSVRVAISPKRAPLDQGETVGARVLLGDGK